VRAALAASVLLVAASAAGWWLTRPPPEPPKVAEDQTFEDMDRAEYEAWMQELGYTD